MAQLNFLQERPCAIWDPQRWAVGWADRICALSKLGIGKKHFKENNTETEYIYFSCCSLTLLISRS